jgi:hypothetical protein
MTAMDQREPQIFIDADRIDLRLKQQFDLSIQDVTAIAQAIYRGFAEVSSLHPKGFNGTNAWAQGTSTLRAMLIPKGWRPDDPQGQPRITSKARKTSITVSSGNADTGVPERSPQTRNDKGSQTASSVQFNARQGQLFPVVTTSETDVARIPASEGNALWVLLYYIDLDAGQTRVELSRPTAMSDADKINSWSVRYILPPMLLGPVMEELPRDEGPDIDFDVAPKIL